MDSFVLNIVIIIIKIYYSHLINRLLSSTIVGSLFFLAVLTALISSFPLCLEEGRVSCLEVMPLLYLSSGAGLLDRFPTSAERLRFRVRSSILSEFSYLCQK